MRPEYMHFLTDIDPQKKILELSPLDNPIFTKTEANIFYSCIRDTKHEKNFYKNDPAVTIDSIVPIDYVINNTYTESLQGQQFDYVISSHVLEHIPDLIDFFSDISNVLKEDGLMYAIIPDCRYCFDHFRQPTSFSELYYINKSSFKYNPIGCLDFFLNYIPCNDPKILWNESSIMEQYSPENSIDNSLKLFTKSMNNEYIDAHYSAFTPLSFLLIIFHMTRLNLLHFELKRIFTTDVNNFSFCVVLKKSSNISSLNSNYLLFLKHSIDDISKREFNNDTTTDQSFDYKLSIRTIVTKIFSHFFASILNKLFK